ncbi:hypothetical protein AB0C76_38045 [Kitasatospora sp. NPDC048722]|uniref:hypothetical protein n=1 Tax=Kitasatospora sp. NPDC048722 TaxID=3155639 RepID=UPI0033E59029
MSSSAEGPWAAAAERACGDLYGSRGTPERATPPDGQMAADARWAADLQGQAASRLGGIGGADSYGALLIQDMKYASALNQDLGRLYGENASASDRLEMDKAQLSQTQQQVAQISDILGTPSCAAVAEETAPAR